MEHRTVFIPKLHEEGKNVARVHANTSTIQHYDMDLSDMRQEANKRVTCVMTFS